MEWFAFQSLSPDSLYALLQLRQEVFIVEQNCAYQDADGVDPQCWHLLAWKNEKLIGTLRVVPAGVKFEECSIGRVCSSPAARKTGIGKLMMEEALQWIENQWGKVPIRIGAQAYLKGFYESLGFVDLNLPFLEDGIPHIEMLKSIG